MGAPVLAPHAVLGPRVDVAIHIENGHDYKVEWHLLEDCLLDEVQRRRHGDPFARVSARINPDKSRIIRIIQHFNGFNGSILVSRANGEDGHTWSATFHICEVLVHFSKWVIPIQDEGGHNA